MKKRIFIAMHYMEIGGAEISLIGLLNAIDYALYDVDLLIYSHQGELMKFIPKEVNLLQESPVYSYIEKPMYSALKAGYFRLVWARLYARYKFKKYCRKNHPKDGSAIFQYVADRVTSILPSLRQYGEYDLAISFLAPHNVVLEKVSAKKKVAWIHTDYSKIEVDAALELPVWNGYDYIVSISGDVTQTFLSTFPSIKNKIVEIHNILSPAFVRSRSKEKADLAPMEKSSNRVNLLSVGRFSDAKNFDNVPDILRKIREQGIDAYWYIIGYGGLEWIIRQKIAETKMQDYVILLGKKDNPYPYIKACDIYVQPSRYEGNSVTVREAQMLYKPVVVTNYATAKSQIHDGIDGVIVPMDNRGCAKGIVELIQNRDKQRQLAEYLSSHDYGNETEVGKIYQLIAKERPQIFMK